MTEPVFDLNDSLFDQDPALVIRSVVAFPNRYFTPEFDIALRDGMRQAAQRQNPSLVDSPYPAPLLNAAIESEDTEEWLLRRFMDGLTAASVCAVNAIYPALQSLEPPLHTAVRLGRPDAVRALLLYPTIHPTTKYCLENSNIRGDCEFAGFAHPFPCIPDSFGTPCLTACEYAIDCFSRAPAGSMLQRNIEICGLVFVAAGSFPGPLTEDSVVVPSFSQAIRVGMNRYAEAVLERILDWPTSSQIQQLKNRGMERILNQSVVVAESSHLVSEIMDMSIDYDIFPMPPIQDLVGENPIAIALRHRHPLNALEILGMLKALEALVYEPNDYITILMRNADMITHASTTDDNFEFFRAYVLFLDDLPFSIPDDDDEDQFYNDLSEFLHQCAYGAFYAGKSAIRNATFLIREQGCNTATSLLVAIECGNVGAFDAIISVWLEHGESLDQARPAVPASQNTKGAEEGWTILGVVIEARLLSAIEVLLNKGADPQVVDTADWLYFMDEIEGAWDTLSKREFVEKYLRYGFFEGGGLIGSEEELNNNQLIDHHVGLMIHVARFEGDGY
ncbi:hypothetical protein F4781DRAFT_396827 [Annulohypoxylon bovei var. microspora]|nr:hypothetical protein F4781DRAFT_396827 [Annulohypoxylon bovei var. microspora]